MLIKRTSPFTGVEHTREIDVTHSQMQAWEDGIMIQQAMPNVPSEEREFIMTGITPEEWMYTFNEG